MDCEDKTHLTPGTRVFVRSGFFKGATGVLQRRPQLRRTSMGEAWVVDLTCSRTAARHKADSAIIRSERLRPDGLGEKNDNGTSDSPRRVALPVTLHCLRD